MCHDCLCLHPLANQGRAGNACTTRSLDAALGPLGASTPPPAICWRAFAPTCSDKTPRLERPAAQDRHRPAAHADVARRAIHALKIAPPGAYNVRQNLEPFSLMRWIERIGLVRCTHPSKTLPTPIELPYDLPPCGLFT